MLSPDVDIFGSREAADYLGIPRRSFRVRLVHSRQGVAKHPFPEPTWTLACGPIWTREQLDEWRDRSMQPEEER